MREVRDAFGNGQVTGRRDKSAVFGDGYDVLIHPETADADAVDGALFGGKIG